MAGPGSDKQEAILNTALTLFVGRGFYGTPTSLISKEAGVATGTLFFYFRTKEELIDTLYLRVKAEAAEAMRQGLDEEETTKGKLRRIWYNAVEWGVENPEKMQFMEQFAHSPFVSSTAHEEGLSRFSFLQEYVLEGIREGVIRDFDPPLLFCMMASTLASVITRVAEVDDPDIRVTIIEQGMDFVWNGLKAETDMKQEHSRKNKGKK
jgi:AcrR family transcriptional regulator